MLRSPSPTSDLSSPWSLNHTNLCIYLVFPTQIFSYVIMGVPVSTSHCWSQKGVLLYSAELTDVGSQFWPAYQRRKRVKTKRSCTIFAVYEYWQKLLQEEWKFTFKLLQRTNVTYCLRDLKISILTDLHLLILLYCCIVWLVIDLNFWKIKQSLYVGWIWGPPFN